MDELEDEKKELEEKLNENEVHEKGTANVSPETRILLDENFWRDATPQKVQELISKGADVNAENKNGMTAAHYAAIHGNIEVLKLLGQSGADMNHGDVKAETPAHKVAKDEQSNDILKELAKYNADFDQTNIYGESPKEMIQKNQQDAPTLLREIEEIQQKKGENPQKHHPNDLLKRGSKEGRDDPRNELNNTPQRDHRTINSVRLNSQKDH